MAEGLLPQVYEVHFQYAFYDYENRHACPLFIYIDCLQHVIGSHIFIQYKQSETVVCVRNEFEMHICRCHFQALKSITHMSFVHVYTVLEGLPGFARDPSPAPGPTGRLCRS